MHRISMVGRDDEGRGRWRAWVWSVRQAAAGSSSWRYESCFKD